MISVFSAVVFCLFRKNVFLSSYYGCFLIVFLYIFIYIGIVPREPHRHSHWASAFFLCSFPSILSFCHLRFSFGHIVWPPHHGSSLFTYTPVGVSRTNGHNMFVCSRLLECTLCTTPYCDKGSAVCPFILQEQM